MAAGASCFATPAGVASWPNQGIETQRHRPGFGMQRDLANGGKRKACNRNFNALAGSGVLLVHKPGISPATVVSNGMHVKEE